MQATQAAARSVQRLDNEAIADRLDEISRLLAEQGANPFRVRAYEAAGDTVRGLRRPAGNIIDREGVEGLRMLPGIGESLADTIDKLAHLGTTPLLERLRGEGEAERIFATVPGIGPGFARRIHESLGIETLPELQAAAADGRLARVPGMGRKRLQSVRETLAGRLRMTPATSAPPPPSDEPPVAELLDIDREYREKADARELPRVAPQRFNPTGAAWLSILHTERGDRHYTALYSNTARAHELGATHDWVVIYRDDNEGHGQWTVITSGFGRLRGRRIVRGREEECAAYYEARSIQPLLSFAE